MHRTRRLILTPLWLLPLLFLLAGASRSPAEPATPQPDAAPVAESMEEAEPAESGPPETTDAVVTPPPRASESEPIAPISPISSPISIPETRLGWTDLTRLAREDVRRGDLTKAQVRLAQASIQVSSLPPTNVRRQTVFGLRARLAAQLAWAGELERANELANELFAEAREAPSVGDDALVALAISVAERRAAEAAEAEGQTASGGRDLAGEYELPLLELALDTAEEGSASRGRLNLAYRVSTAALSAGNLGLARRAIDRALGDARIINASDLDQIASIHIYRARIESAQGELEAAEADAIRANQIFEEREATEANRGVGEATLAEILAKRGEIDRARAVVKLAESRTQQEVPLPQHAKRLILGAVARVEAASGHTAVAIQRYSQALDLPGEDFEPDRYLVKQLATERAALRATHQSPDSGE